MKSAPIIALMIVAIMAATILHAGKNSREIDDIDKAASGLAGIDTILPPNASLFIQQFVQGEQWHYCRYVLVPRNVVLLRKGFIGTRTVDTIIAITPLNPTDSITRAITTNRKVLWQHADQYYQYYLTCTNR